jgi:mono/diheme cytochrome c family protein
MATDNGTTNITPLTTIVLSSAVSGADLDNLYTNPGFGDLKNAAARIPDAVTALQSALDPLLKQYGISGNILNTPFNANHTGVDALLDAITVSISAGTVTITDKGNSATVIFSAPCANIKAGTLVMANIPTATTVPTSTPVPTPTPVPTNNPSQSPTLDGAALYANNCEGCHGALATSSKTGITSTRLSNAISSDLGGMGSLSSLTSAEQQAIVMALTPATAVPTPTPSTAADGVSLYGSSCSGCHGTLASSGKAGATNSRIQTAINNNTGGMGYLISLNSSQITAIASALTTVTQPSTPSPTAVCGSCHSIPPANGQHSRHLGKGVACATCHGTGYSTTTFNSSTHNNGIKNLASTIGWNSTSRSCSNSCHGTERW